MRNEPGSTRYLRAIAFATGMLCSLPAFADIAAFNKAVQAGDYKAAAAEAAATWPTLDKGRSDIGVIAQEFGYAAFLIQDFVASRSFAEFAVNSPSTATDARVQAVSLVLLMLSDHRLKPTTKTRKELMAAITRRASLPGYDNISYRGVNAVIDWDVENAEWDDAETSSGFGVKLAAAGGSHYLPQLRRMETLSIVAEAGGKKSKDAYPRIAAILQTIIRDIDAAPSDEGAKAFAPVYWEARTWGAALSWSTTKPTPGLKPSKQPSRARKLLELDKEYAASGCEVAPPLELFPFGIAKALPGRSQGAAIVRIDTDRAGNVTKAELLGAVPEKTFGSPVLEFVRRTRMRAGRVWDKINCSLETTATVLEFQFGPP